MNLQHADGRTALDNGQVNAWSGLDPIMAAAEVESGDVLFYRNLNQHLRLLNATEVHSVQPDRAQTSWTCTSTLAPGLRRTPKRL